MSKRDPGILLDDIRTAIEKIDRYTASLDECSFLSDEKTQDAVIRNLEIIGEAVKQLPAELSGSIRLSLGHKLRGYAIESSMIMLGSILSWCGIF